MSSGGFYPSGSLICLAYITTMNAKTNFLNEPARSGLAVVFITLLAGCKPAVPPPVNAASPPPQPAAVVVAAPPVPVVVEDDYVYYPGYEVYYSPSTHVYWYMHGGAWVTGPAVPGVSFDVLLGSPSVRMDFHDSPANHHDTVVRQYPRGWRPPDEGHR